MSPPTVTRIIGELEAHLGTRLLQRTTRRLSLTEAGESYLNRVRGILLEIEEAEADASAHSLEFAGRLRVHAPPVLASYVIAPLLSGFRKSYPNILVQLQVETLNEPPIEDFDVTLVSSDAGLGADVVTRKVTESPAILVASSAYVQRKGAPRTPEELTQHECLRLKLPHDKTWTWRLWRRQDSDEVKEVTIHPAILANHTDTLLRAAIDGAGITSVSLAIAAPYLTRGDLVPVLSPWITGILAMYAVMPSRNFVPKRTRAFLDYLVEQSREQTAKALEACTEFSVIRPGE